jgi:transcription antitermination protein NusB
MANRHLARTIVLQTLFEWDFGHMRPGIYTDILNRNIAEFAPEIAKEDFAERLLEGVVRKQPVIDQIIQKAAPEWPIEKIGIPDRNVLRIGLYELLFGNREEVPPKVAINEAIELAKKFGGEKTGRFINGVLGAVYKELGEPEKDQISKKKVYTPVDESKLPIEKKAGAVIYSISDGIIRIALVHDVFGYWTLSKGGIESNEDEEKGAIREIKDELGIKVKIVDRLGENTYIASHPEKGKLKKNVILFLAESKYEELYLESSGGLDGAEWFELNELPNLKMYDDIVPMITKAVSIITSK